MCANNIRSEILDLPEVTSANWKGVTSVTQKVYPLQPVIGTNGVIAGDLIFQYTVPAGYRQDVSRSYIFFKCSIGLDVPVVNDVISTAPAPNFCSTFFNTARMTINDYLVSSSNNVSYDDTMMKRMLNSYTKNKSINSLTWLYGTDTDRFDIVQVPELVHELAWRPDVILSPSQVITENARVNISLAINPLINTAASSPCFVCKTDAAGDGRVVFSSIYMVNTYIKVDVPRPMEVLIPAYNVKSSFQSVGAGQNNLQFNIPKDTYKIVVGLISNAATVHAGKRTTKFTSGGIHDAQDAYSKLLTNMVLRYGGQSYPASGYTLDDGTAGVSSSADAYMDFIGGCDGQFDNAGQEAYDEWRDPKTILSHGLGRLLCHNIIKSDQSADANCELSLTFSADPVSTQVILFAITKQAIGLLYDSNAQIIDVKPVNFS